jgi:hypothetical protein
MGSHSPDRGSLLTLCKGNGLESQTRAGLVGSRSKQRCSSKPDRGNGPLGPLNRERPAMTSPNGLLFEHKAHAGPVCAPPHSPFLATKQRVP